MRGHILTTELPLQKSRSPSLSRDNHTAKVYAYKSGIFELFSVFIEPKKISFALHPGTFSEKVPKR